MRVEHAQAGATPSTTISLEVDACCLSSLAGAYSGESLQARARSRLGNSMITTRRGDQSPSRFSICPGWRQLGWPVDDNYLGRFCTGAGPVQEAGLT